MRRISIWLAGVFFLLVAGLAVLQSFCSPLGLYDEGFALTNALRILMGDVPHLHYWAAYPPGTSIVLSVFFTMFGPSIVVARWVNLLWSLLLLTSFFTVARFYGSFFLSSVVTALASLWLAVAIYPSYSGLPALALAFFSIAIFIYALKHDFFHGIVVAGLSFGIIILFRHDFSGYMLLSCCIAFIFTKQLVQSNRSERDLSRFGVVILLLFFTALISFSVLLSVVGWHDFYLQALVFPATGMRQNRLLPVPGLFDFFVSWKVLWGLAWIVPIFSVIGLLNLHFQRCKLSAMDCLVAVVLASMSLFLSVQSHNRLDMAHAAPSMLFLLCLLTVLASRHGEGVQDRIMPWSMLFAFFLYSTFTVSPFVRFGYATQCIRTSYSLGECIGPQKMQSDVVDFINKNFSKSEYVFVGNTRHDSIFTNDASLYFLIKRPIPVKWNEMHPGIVNTLAVQQKIVRSLETSRVRVVVLADMPVSKEDNLSSKSTGVYLLDNYIKENFRPVFANKKYIVLLRADVVAGLPKS